MNGAVKRQSKMTQQDLDDNYYCLSASDYKKVKSDTKQEIMSNLLDRCSDILHEVIDDAMSEYEESEEFTQHVITHNGKKHVRYDALDDMEHDLTDCININIE